MRLYGIVGFAVWLGLPTTSPAGEAKKDPPRRVLPGVDNDGLVRLPNQWAIRPAGKQIELGDFPVNMVLHPSGKWMAILHAGYRDHEVVIVNLDSKRPRLASRVIIDQTFLGLCFTPDGKTLFASGGEFDVVHAFAFADGNLSNARTIKLGKKKFIPGGMTVDRDGQALFVAGVWGHAVSKIDLRNGKANGEPLTRELGKDTYPYACLVDAKRKRLLVSLWSKASIAVLDLDGDEFRPGKDPWPTEKHPTEMVLSPDGKTLYVACSNSTKVSVLDADTGKGLQTIGCALYPGHPAGNTPSSLCLTPDGQLLFVANADANNVAVFNVSERGKAKPLGFIPVGMYPTAVRYGAKDKKLYVLNGRGVMPHANRHGPGLSKTPLPEYIAALYRGTLSILDVPDEKRMIQYTKQAYACSPLREDLGVTGPAPKDSPIPAKVGKPSPIKHCVYIIRENRTYDQIFGDVKEGNGDAGLCLFPEKITPNAHRLARQFVLLDNFYCDGEVSAEGHEWSMGAYCTDFVKKVWPLSYRGSPTKKLNIYPAEGNFDEIARPAGGYLWDRCADAGVSYRSYGEWIQNGKTPKDPGKARVKALEGHFDPGFRSYDLDYSDVLRAERFIAELKRFEKEGQMPRLQIVRLPNDHTHGTKVGKLTPTALVAQNDLALGMVVEAISKSKFWKDTAIFIVEDDAQNGPDHVDAHRSVALVISPYAQRKHVDSTMYSTASVLRTMELILGLRPMSPFDAAARPMYNSFQARPDLTPYAHVVPDVDIKALNPKTAWGADLSEKMDFSVEDAADDLLLNEVVWRSVRGPDSPMPPPVRAAFVFPHLPKEDKED